jgi:ParB/RepB/Spo0J family partition protein
MTRNAITDEPAIAAGHEVIELLPNQIRTLPEYNVRLWSGNGEEELIIALARQIEESGQEEAAIVVPVAIKNGPEDYVLVAGHRRLQAVQLVNERRSARGKGLLRLRCVVDRSERDHLHTAIATNVQRRNLSPMDLALLIERLRKKFKWAGQTGTAQVAAYLGVLRITVTQHERLRTLSDDLQEQVHRGTLTPQSAFELMPFPPEERPRILHRAREIQSERDAAAEEEKGEEAVATVPHIQHPAMRQAVRERTSVAVRPMPPLDRRELLEAVEQFDADPYGWPDGAVRRWVRYFVDEYARGRGDEAEMRRLFGCMIVGCVKGTPGSASAARSGVYRAERRDKKR